MKTEFCREEFQKELTEHILPFWMRLKDEKFGGFYGFMDVDLCLDKTAEKGCILNSRLLWTFSNAVLVLKDEKYLPYAKHAYEFLAGRFFDRKNGGIYWSLNYKGEPLDTVKHSYNTAFAVYALSSYYDASKDEEALLLAKELYQLLEMKYKDEYGYKEAFTVDFQPQSNEHLSENGVMAAKTMNTTLHIFEAYTELYRVSGLAPVKKSMQWILDLFCEKIYNPKLSRMEVFFDEQMNTLIDLHSYGHDIETAWLLDRGLEVLQDDARSEKCRHMIASLEKKILEAAYNGESLPAECENGRVLETRVWWVQCEAIIGFYNAYQKCQTNSGQTDADRRGALALSEKYLDAVKQIWEYTKKYMIDDREGGEWLNERLNDKTINRRQPVVSPWKCPYHNSRMCLEMVRRMER